MKKIFKKFNFKRVAALGSVLLILTILVLPCVSFSASAAVNTFSANVGIYIDNIDSLIIYDSVGIVTTLNQNNTSYTFTYPTNTSPTITSAVQGGVTRYSALYNITIRGYYSQYMFYEVGSSGSGLTYSNGETVALQNGINIMIYGQGERSSSLQTVNLTLSIRNIQNYGYIPPSSSIPSLDDTWIIFDEELDFNGYVDVELNATIYDSNSSRPISFLAYYRGMLELYSDSGDISIGQFINPSMRLMYIDSIDETQSYYSNFYSLVSTNAVIVSYWDDNFTQWLYDSLHYSFNSGYGVGYDAAIGVNTPAYDQGYNDGLNAGFGENLLGSTLSAPIKALNSFVIVSTPLGDITLGAVVGSVISLSLFIMFLKYFAGG